MTIQSISLRFGRQQLGSFNLHPSFVLHAALLLERAFPRCVSLAARHDRCWRSWRLTALGRRVRHLCCSAGRSVRRLYFHRDRFAPPGHLARSL